MPFIRHSISLVEEYGHPSARLNLYQDEIDPNKWSCSLISSSKVKISLTVDDLKTFAENGKVGNFTFSIGDVSFTVNHSNNSVHLSKLDDVIVHLSILEYRSFINVIPHCLSIIGKRIRVPTLVECSLESCKKLLNTKQKIEYAINNKLILVKFFEQFE